MPEKVARAAVVMITTGKSGSYYTWDVFLNLKLAWRIRGSQRISSRPGALAAIMQYIELQSTVNVKIMNFLQTGCVHIDNIWFMLSPRANLKTNIRIIN